MANTPARPTFNFLPDDHIAAYLAMYPASSQWFTGRGVTLDNPTQSFAQACNCQGCSSCVLELALIVQAPAWDGDADELCSGMALDELIDHLSVVHHAFTRAELGRLARIADHLRTTMETGGQDSWFRTFDRLRRHLLAHLGEEEQFLFPRVRQLEAHPMERPITSVACDHSLHIMEHGHREVEDSIGDLVQELAGQDWPTNLRNAADVFLAGVENLRRDVAVHSYKEDEYLLPAISYADELFDSRHRARMRNAGFSDSSDDYPIPPDLPRSEGEDA
ncbi:MAG: hemerythrin domain-containing protein [Planctomycetota bacterium]|jgi:iron-sulfur cluster repair protein YtfE (RIC family)|nr:hemerythrin domain-containing protein [Planctomycetota bacterium]